ncbi:membrane protein [Lachnospiraceae bacterium]|uniref:DUF2871 domain-containing protein n=1 Tax=Extibacter sp. GGCC_0201 TaxID=2731209 RepID=UPI001AA0E86E|nr:DUF2871 domain-containing protein [Extibacter sp. GGCC_0201]MBO1720819.1 DUF2871 domain-containing protein [Extibacter sp. GGCC_0201]BDF33368.1 membrane protein [Lachnospiraceae bacterium]BDF37372.1 membrane protein [Lachnospiraceae bacterium]
MKKLWRISFIYLLAGIASGVFYREYTKYMAFDGRTTLAFTHVHLIVLGTLLFLVLMLFCKDSCLLQSRKFKVFLILYNIALPLMAVMLLVRGITQVQALPLSRGADAAISGIAGISHIMITAALVVLMLAIKNCFVDSKPHS